MTSLPLHEVNDRDGAGDAVSDIRRPSLGWTATQRGSRRPRSQLAVDVMAVLVFHANDGDTVRLTIDHDEVASRPR